jgi:hypothetical protein
VLRTQPPLLRENPKFSTQFPHLAGDEHVINRNCLQDVLHDHNPLPSLRDVELLEARLGIQFPEDFRDYLLNYNGGYFDRALLSSVSDANHFMLLEKLKCVNAGTSSMN